MHNDLLNRLQSLIKDWPDYHSNIKVDSNHPTEKVISTEMPALFEELTPNAQHYKFQGSSGKGNLSAAPWFATFHNGVTDTAQDGFYIVTLISLDLKRIILEIGFGAFQFERRYGVNQTQKNALRKAAATYQAVVDLKISEICNQEFNQRLSKEKADLKAGSNKRYIGYENGSIYHLEYQASEIASSTFLNDYLEFVRLYEWMANSPLLPDVDDVSWDGAKAPELDFGTDIQEFIPQIRKKKSKSNNSGTSSSKRYSKQAHIIGRTGEEYVYDYEVSRLNDLGRSDLAEKVVWEADKGNTPGWDITSFEEDGSERLIEVKSTDSETISSLILTSNEWDTAQIKENSYWIYLVTSVRKSPKIQTIQNPGKYVNDDLMMASVNSWELKLYSFEDE